MVPRMSSDPNVLFGTIAVQMRFVSQDAVARATAAWERDKSRVIAEILVEQGDMTPTHAAMVTSQVRNQLRQAEDDTQQSFVESVRQAPADLTDGAEQGRQAPADVTDEGGDDGFQHTMTQRGGGSVPVQPSGDGGPGTVATPAHFGGQMTLPSGGAKSSAAPADGRRFRVIRPHARGGLGEVFLAQDQELNREVALKEILSRHAVDADSRGRFLLEAEITGGLEHPGIVPVYGLGTYPDGRPYYAMRFIQGDSLKDTISRYHTATFADDGARNLAFRNLLKRFVDVCNAIGYAHSRGVLHRDLKPGNIMIGKYGETLVVDWGLAKAIGDTSPDHGGTADGAEKSIQPVNASSYEQTVAGQAVGTPAFMSPEQAEGRLDIMGKPSDIYSLGATLYALIVNDIPFNGKKVDELLARVKRGEFTPPVQAKPGTPPALSAIVVKAMALKPENRYPTALALGEDIDHYLADEPVFAYPEPWPDRARRWARKHRTFVSAAAVMLVTSVAALGAGLYFVNAEKNRTVQERNEKELARAAEQQQRVKAESARNAAMDALDAMTSNFTRDALISQQEITPEQRKFLEEAHAYYRQLMTEEGAGEVERKRQAQAAFRVGTIERRLGRNEEAETSFVTAVGLFQGMVGDFPAQSEYRHDQARAFNNIGLVRHQAARYQEAADAFVKAVAIQEPLAGEHPETPEYARQWARTLTNLGNTRRVQGDIPAAVQALRKAIDIQTTLAEAHPKVPDYRNELAGSVSNLAITLLERGRPDEAEPLLKRALGIRETLRAEAPAEAAYQEDLAKTRVNLATAAKALGNAVDAVGELKKAAEIYESLQQAYPSMPQYQQHWASAHYSLGEALRSFRPAASAEPLDAVRRAMETQTLLAKRFPKTPEHRLLLARSHNLQGNLLLDRKQTAEAGKEYAAAIDLQTKLVDDFPKTREYRADLALSLNNRGVYLRDANQLAAAEKDFRAAYDIQEQLVKEFPAHVAYQLNQAMTCRNFGELKRPAPGEAAPWFDRAIALADGVYEKTPTDTKALVQLKDALAGRQKLFDDQKEVAKAAADAGRVAELNTTLALRNAVNLIAAGHVAAVMPAVEKLAKNSDLRPHHQVDFARVYAMAAARDPDNAKKFADEAVARLKTAAAGGYVVFTGFERDPDFAAILERADFKQVVAGK